MHGDLTHFALNADDVPATRRFYEALFGWQFEEAYPGFLRTTSAGPAIGAIQGRRELVAGVRTTGAECSFEVSDLAAATAVASAHGGRVVLPPSTIPGVGVLAFLSDPSGNPLGVIRYGVEG